MRGGALEHRKDGRGGRERGRVRIRFQGVEESREDSDGGVRWWNAARSESQRPVASKVAEKGVYPTSNVL